MGGDRHRAGGGRVRDGARLLLQGGPPVRRERPAADGQHVGLQAPLRSASPPPPPPRRVWPSAPPARTLASPVSSGSTRRSRLTRSCSLAAARPNLLEGSPSLQY